MDVITPPTEAPRKAHAAFSAAMPAAATRDKPAKVLVVDDHELVRIGIKSILATSGLDQLEIMDAANLADAIDLYRAQSDIALVLLDLNMPDCRGLNGLRQFLAEFPRARIAVVSATQDEFVVGQVRALGAIGYLTKGQAPTYMVDFVTRLIGNRADASGAAPSQSACNGYAQFPRSSKYDRVAELGPRHLEILDQVLFGCSNQEISTSTGLSLGTIKNYVSTILLAMDVKSRSHLISLFR